MRPKILTIDFYRAFQDVSMGDLIQRVDRMPDDEDRCVDLGGNPVRLARLEEVGGSLVGELVRLRMDEPAVLGNAAGSLKTVVVDDDEGLSGFTSFLYNTAANILCIERNRTGVGQKNFCRYFQEKGGLEGGIDLDVIIEPGALDRIADWQRFRTLEVSIAPVSTLTPVRPETLVSKALQSADRLSAAHVYMKFSMGHYAGGMNRRGVLQTIREIWSHVQRDDQRIDVLRLTGSEGLDDEITPIDLLENRVTYSAEIELSHDPERLYSVRKSLLRTAWHDKRSIIRGILDS